MSILDISKTAMHDLGMITENQNIMMYRLYRLPKYTDSHKNKICLSRCCKKC